jgi:hypothetical protein
MTGRGRRERRARDRTSPLEVACKNPKLAFIGRSAASF